ncbi:glycosyltransferase [Devosia salina]|uniref:Glycosyltransferase n=1 Tax=Devosia salina TaxID=2860336 RepID=A0ABX8WFV8_9HYPH|nr:glycosyltransferase [Devosia salina]QYO77768.1 glycosyltransferase [Devosia salina]
MNVLIVCNDLPYFLAHRLPLARAILASGGRLALVCGGDSSLAAALPPEVEFHPIAVDRHRLNLLPDIGLVRKVRSLLRTFRPDVMHCITIKPILMAGLALALSRQRTRTRAVFTFAGLGRVFEAGGGASALRRTIVVKALKLATARLNCAATFENQADADTLVRYGIFAPDQTHALFGAGIDTRAFTPPSQPRTGRLTILFASRLLRAKGIDMFLEMASKFRQSGAEADFLVAGLPDPGNPDAIDPAAIAEAEQQGWVRHLGPVSAEAMPDLLRGADIVCLPTRLREGFPRVLIEAAACGCALIGSRQPSIAQVIEDGSNGWMVDTGTTQELEAALASAIADPAKTRAMGMTSAAMLETKVVDERDVSAQFLAIYQAKAVKREASL